jgi:hypothetical protein
VKRRTRLLGGLTFECYEPGHWLGAEGRLALLHLMQGTTLSEWHLFRTRPGMLPRKPFAAGAAFWGWHDLSYTLTMGEMDKIVRDLREKSRAMLPRLRSGETVVRCGKDWRLVIAVHPDGDGDGAVLDVEAEDGSLLRDEQWSTYGCLVEERLPVPWPKRKTRQTRKLT